MQAFHSHISIRLIVLGIFGVACLFPLLGNRILSSVENFGRCLAEKKLLSILLVIASVVFVRLSLLPLLPVPVPTVDDKFSFLLEADTFAHGRLANPPHPISIYLDTLHVNQHPSYVSIYPPAQGAALAFGEILGSPWIGVLLSVAFMCGAILWMLHGWLPPHWAFLGGILVILHIGLNSSWMNSYWGGQLQQQAELWLSAR